MQGQEGQQVEWEWAAAAGWVGLAWVVARPGVLHQLLLVPPAMGCPRPDMEFLQGRPHHSMGTCLPSSL